uniref:50S ribosomal protein L30 n=1 Tax=Desulfobacca acetoxidans TaxID=60893 RepID=A0A7V4G8A8_9BACT
MMLEITLIKSPIGRPPQHRTTVKTLGLTKMHKTVRHKETPAIAGMVKQVRYLVAVRRLPEGD